jgi:hypothetical protein
MFTCERCGSRYSEMHAAALENCPRCQIRDRVSAPLTFKMFRLPPGAERPEPLRLDREDAEVIPNRSLGAT